MREFFKRFISRFKFKKHKEDDLRQKCIDAYGEKFGELYDFLCSGVPIGGFVETAIIIEMIDAVKRGDPIKLEGYEKIC
jgi:hypothetical protein